MHVINRYPFYFFARHYFIIPFACCQGLNPRPRIVIRAVFALGKILIPFVVLNGFFLCVLVSLAVGALRHICHGTPMTHLSFHIALLGGDLVLFFLGFERYLGKTV